MKYLIVLAMMSVSCASQMNRSQSHADRESFIASSHSDLAKSFSIVHGFTAHKPKTLDDKNSGNKFFSSADDEAVLRRWLAWAHPGLDQFMQDPNHPYFTKYKMSLREIALKMTFLIDYGPDIENMGGASAEDDPSFYIYPNQEFYHVNTNPNGKIRITVTEYFIRTLQLVEAIEKERNVFLVATRQRTRGFLAHELLHAAQFSFSPVRNAANFTEGIKNGLATDWLYEDSVKKVTVYEPEGLFMQHLFDKDLTSELEKFASEVKSYKEKYPNKFLAGSEFELLGKHQYKGMGQQASNIEFDLSVAGEVRAKKWKSASFIGIMDGLTVPLKTVRDLSGLAQKICRKKMSPNQAQKELESLTQPWFNLFTSADKIYMDPKNPVIQTIMSRHPYHESRGVFARFETLYQGIKKGLPPTKYCSLY
jgi:hypothetical protein